MGVNSLPKTVTRQRRVYDLNLSPSAPESSTLTTRLPSHPLLLLLLLLLHTARLTLHNNTGNNNNVIIIIISLC